MPKVVIGVQAGEEAVARLMDEQHGMVSQMHREGHMRLSLKDGWTFIQFVIPGHHVVEMLEAWAKRIATWQRVP